MKKTLTVFLLAFTLAAIPLLHVLADDVIWADGMVTLDEDLLDDIATLLETTPPDDAEGLIYAVTHVSGTDSAWSISLVNLVDVAAPYDVWTVEENAVWVDSVICSGTDPDWTCDYMEVPALGGSSGLILPWVQGYSALYGVKAVHHDGSIPNTSAVDFVGNGASGIMPPKVVAVADGVISWVCPDDGLSTAIKVVGGPIPVYYFHFASGQVFTEGDTVRQGEVLGTLKYGNFSGNCGTGTQQATSYHLHFVFPTSSTLLAIGDCVLDQGTQKFVCGGNTYGALSYIPNSGGSSDLGDIPSETGDGSSSAMGGARLWDGVLSGMTSMLDEIASNLTEHTTIGLESVITNSVTYLSDLYMMVSGLQLFYVTPAFIIIGFYLALEVIRWSLAIIRWILQFIPTMG